VFVLLLLLLRHVGCCDVSGVDGDVQLYASDTATRGPHECELLRAAAAFTMEEYRRLVSPLTVVLERVLSPLLVDHIEEHAWQIHDAPRTVHGGGCDERTRCSGVCVMATSSAQRSTRSSISNNEEGKAAGC